MPAKIKNIRFNQHEYGGKALTVFWDNDCYHQVIIEYPCDADALSVALERLRHAIETDPNLKANETTK